MCGRRSQKEWEGNCSDASGARIRAFTGWFERSWPGPGGSLDLADCQRSVGTRIHRCAAAGCNESSKTEKKGCKGKKRRGSHGKKSKGCKGTRGKNSKGCKGPPEEKGKEEESTGATLARRWSLDRRRFGSASSWAGGARGHHGQASSSAFAAPPVVVIKLWLEHKDSHTERRPLAGMCFYCHCFNSCRGR